MHSWHARADGIVNFYTRRLFRIAPLFWLMIPIYLMWNHSQHQPGEVLATALFVNGFMPNYIFGVVQGGWSIAVEMSFYLVFPLLAL